MDETLIRFLFLIAGAIIGAALGSLYSTNRYIKRVVANTEETRMMIEKWCREHNETPPKMPPVPPGKPVLGWRDRGDTGAVTFSTIGMILALVIVVFSLISTLRTNQAVADTQRVQAESAATRDRENACTSSVLFATIAALNERTTYTTAQADANIRLQKAQLRLLRTPANSSPSVAQAALTEYVDSLTSFIRVTAKQSGQAEQNPYPTQDEYSRCLSEARNPVKSDTVRNPQ